MVSIQYTARLLNRNRNPQVRRRRRIASVTARTMKTLPTIGINQLKNHTPEGLMVDGGASCDVAKSIGASQRASDGERSGIVHSNSLYVCNLVHYMSFVIWICGKAVRRFDTVTVNCHLWLGRAKGATH